MERIGKVQIEHRYQYIDKNVAVQSWPALSAPFILQKIFAARPSCFLVKLYRVQDKPEKESVGTGLCSRISLQGFVGVRQDSGFTGANPGIAAWQKHGRQCERIQERWLKWT